MRIRVCLFCIIVLAWTPAFAWHSVGHRATASIAFDAMSAEQQQNVIRILRGHPRFDEDFLAHMPDMVKSGSPAIQGRWLLEQAAFWPDQIQLLDEEIRRQYNRPRWHYINLVVYLTPEDEAAFDGNFGHNMATEFEPPFRQNLNLIQALRGNLQVWQDTTSTDEAKAVALCWILHLTGDLHQPLHNVALFSKAYFPEGDRGGNSIEVVRDDEVIDLHAYWDSLPTHMASLEPSQRTLLTIETETVDDVAIDEWLSHHANLARMFVYPPEVKEQILDRLTRQQTPRFTASHEYLVRAQSIARRQVNLAGHRIAKLLTAL